MKLPFYESPVCASRAHCAACRNQSPAGQAWREQIAKLYQFDPHGNCPHGIAWSITIDPAKPLAPAVASQPVIPCEGRINEPGSLIKAIFHALGIAPTSDCGCEAFCRQMNQWGWKGCLKERKAIVAWFAAKAEQQGLALTRGKLASTIIRIIAKRKPTQRPQ